MTVCLSMHYPLGTRHCMRASHAISYAYISTCRALCLHNHDYGLLRRSQVQGHTSHQANVMQITKTALFAVVSKSVQNYLPGMGDCRCIISCFVILGEDEVRDEGCLSGAVLIVPAVAPSAAAAAADAAVTLRPGVEESCCKAAAELSPCLFQLLSVALRGGSPPVPPLPLPAETNLSDVPLARLILSDDRCPTWCC